MSYYRQNYQLPSLPPQPLLFSPLPQPQPHLHFHSPGFHPHYHYAPPILPVPKFHIPTHVIQQQQYHQYQANLQRQSSNNAYQQHNSRRIVTNDKKKEVTSEDIPKEVVISDNNKTSRKKSFSLARCVKSSKNWYTEKSSYFTGSNYLIKRLYRVIETFCFCLIDDNSKIIDMSSTQIHAKDT